MSDFKRTKASEDVAGPKSLDLAYNDRAGAYKHLGPIIGKLKILGVLSSAIRIEQGKLIAVYNNSGSAAFIAMSQNPAMAAPTSPADGFPCSPNSYTIFAMGEDSVIIGSSGNLYAYEILDESNYCPVK